MEGRDVLEMLDMFATSAKFPDRRSLWLKPKHISRVLKAAAAACAILYLINVVAFVAGYASAIRTDNSSLGEHVIEAIWVGVSWPALLHNMMMEPDLRRLDPLASDRRATGGRYFIWLPARPREVWRDVRRPARSWEQKSV
jgi:hypothetical protein